MLRLRTIEERTLQAAPAHPPQTRREAARRGFWRSPADQPPWARPALLSIACLAGLAYAWGSDNANLEPFYGAAARSMSNSWHDFFFGAFDPAGTVTVDKLPGALWLQALSLRVLGFHVWAVVLPQILEGVATILVLYRAVRRLAGPVAGITAAAVLAASPVTVALNRGNVSDSLLILLTVLAADATSSALLSGRLRTLLLAGAWVGLAFQAKMLQAWLVLPALAVAYLVAAPPRLRIRIGHVALAGLLAAAVSLSWMTAVSLVPAHERPYVDGTRNDSVYSQVLDYNGLSRIGIGSGSAGAGPKAEFLTKLAKRGRALNSQTLEVEPSWHRLLSGLFGRDDGWLLPAALIAAIGVLLERRGTGRRDPLRAAVLLWGTWLTVLGAAFSAGVYLNSYYVAALSPATAALCGAGVAVCWRRRREQRARAALAGALLACTAYGAYLLSGGTAVPALLLPLALCLGIAGTLIALLLGDPRGEPATARPAAAAVVACALALPVFTSLVVVAHDLGPFDAPFQPGSQAASRFSAQLYTEDARLFVDHLSAVSGHTPIAFAADTSSLTAPFIYHTGKEVLPIGGYLGGVPSPTLGRLRRYIDSGQLAAFFIPVDPPSSDPRIVWVRTHCRQSMQLGRRAAVQYGVYVCSPTTSTGTAQPTAAQTDGKHGLTSGVRLVFRVDRSTSGKVTPALLDRAIAIMRARVEQLGGASAEIHRVGADEIGVVLPNASIAREAREQVGKTGALYFYDWEPNVIGPHGRPAPSDADVTGGPEAASVRYGLVEYRAVLRAAKRAAILRANDTTFERGCTPQQVGDCRYGSWYLLDTRHEKMLCPSGGPVCPPQDTEADLFADGYRPPAGARVEAVRVNPGTVLAQAHPEEFAGKTINPSPNSFYVLNDNPALSGADIENPAQSFQEGGSDSPDVTFGFSPHGRAAFEKVTKQIAQRGANAQLPGVTKEAAEQHFAVVFDEEVITAPSIDFTQYPEGIDAANGSEIAGGLTTSSARDLADELQLGALPVKPELISISRVATAG
jgi:4-amino-4-deoxy-L-arabinose transferase-like glycosyltransferase